ncbi:MAG: alpha/beta hydrolase [Myxococcales bacterium]
MVEATRVGGRAATFRRQSGTTPALVCVHGASDNQHAYDRLLDAVPSRAAYAINLPARAGTEGPAAKSVAEMERFLSELVKSQVDGGYVAVGHSLGGAVVIEHALVAPPAGLQGLVLLATGARLRVHPMILALWEQGAASGKLPPMPAWIHEEGIDPAGQLEVQRKRELTPVSTGAVDWRAADEFDRMDSVAGIEVPTLVIGGTADALTPPKYAEYLARHIPRAELHLLEGAGHMLVLDRAEEVARLIETFVAGLPSPSS